MHNNFLISYLVDKKLDWGGGVKRVVAISIETVLPGPGRTGFRYLGKSIDLRDYLADSKNS